MLDWLFGSDEAMEEEDSPIKNLPGLEFDWTYDEKDEESGDQHKQRMRQEVQQEYPYLNSQQIELIVTVDYAIDHSVPRVKLPKIKLKNMKKRRTYKDFLWALRTPLITFVTTVAVTLALIYSTTIRTWYPYLVTLCTFLASTPSMYQKYNGYYFAVQRGMDAVKTKVEPAINKLEREATNLVVLARRQLNPVVSSFKYELRTVSQTKKALETSVCEELQQVPDIDELENKLDQQEQLLRDGIANARSHLDLDRYTPAILTSHRRFLLCILVPLFILMLAIQLFFTWLWGSDEYLDGVYNEESKWEPLVMAAQSFGIAVLQVAFSFFLTRAKRIVGFCNRKIRRWNRNMNTLLRQKAGNAFHSVLHDAMEYIRERILQLAELLQGVHQSVTAVRDSVQQAESKTGQVKNVTMSVESAVQQVSGVETNVASAWMERIQQFLHTVAQHLDDCSAGLIDCTGGGEADDQQEVLQSSNDKKAENLNDGKQQ